MLFAAITVGVCVDFFVVEFWRLLAVDFGVPFAAITFGVSKL